jgi:predicted DNA binding CopG/RHH family protein
MGKTSTTAKNKYNAKAYDAIPLRVKSGQKEIIKAFADSKGMSMQGFINEAIKKAMEE